MPPSNSRGFFPPRQMPPGPPSRNVFGGMGGRIRNQGFNMGNNGFRSFPGQPFGQGAMQAAGRGGGLKGLLSRFMPGAQGAANIQAGSAGASGGLQGLMNPSNITGMLGNVQKVLGIAQQVTPVVQQYGPLVKNLPAMIKIYSQLKNSDSGDEEESTTENKEPIEAKNQKEPPSQEENVEKPLKQKPAKQPAASTSSKKKKSSGASIPRLYV
ncbi:hypothetical protein IC621_17990 [Bacillus sp. IB182487]|uniref:YqfQ-like protein n=2 Tax=Metabacillus arenae TaxID=2771434 RepID=A0A926NJX0_9BACI|nr:hypothetical protein [Metabacillus arenae]